MAKKILIAFGTRPEAIKMAPVVLRLRADPAFDVRVCSTGQHTSMLEQVVRFFGIPPDIDLAVMTPDQSLNSLFAKVVDRFDAVLESERPDWVVVHGDTSTAAACSLAAFHRRIPTAHVEAGLRSGDLHSPWPEELNRRIVDLSGDLLFAPTDWAADNLRTEGVAESRILVTGNTIVDALIDARARIEDDAELSARLAETFRDLKPDRRLVLVTAHRRENFGAGLEELCGALLDIAAFDNVELVFPVHFNPNVRAVVQKMLGAAANIRLIEPVDYPSFVYLMARAALIVTDSGGVQEEAPTFGTPVLLARDTTERPEAIEAGVVRLVGPHRDAITRAADAFLNASAAHILHKPMRNPYGDGRAAERIAKALSCA